MKHLPTTILGSLFILCSIVAYFLNMNYHTIDGYSYEINICALGFVCFAGVVLFFSTPSQVNKIITKVINFILRKR